MTQTITVLPEPFDAHCHLRQGDMLPTTVWFAAKYFSCAVAMGNTVPAIATADDVARYEAEILDHVPRGRNFTPTVAMMLTRKTTAKTIREAGKRGIAVLKYIPKGVSTNSEESISLEQLPQYFSVMDAAVGADMVFSGHWEAMRDRDGEEVHELFREQEAIYHLDNVVKLFPSLKIVVEHASTKAMIDYVKTCPLNVRCTLTLHHALIEYWHVFGGDGKTIVNPHLFCKPVAKREEDKRAVLEAMLSGDPRFFFGSDSAPHLKSAKEKTPPPAGIFSAPVAIPKLAEIFFAHGKTANDLANFTSRFGLKFYGKTMPQKTITLARKDWVVPPEYHGLVPFLARQTLHWQVV